MSVSSQIPEVLVDQALVRWPVPLAEAIAALESSGGLHERRDRVVEVFRVTLRLVGALALAVRV